MFVTNTTWEKAPFADVLFAMDEKWWRIHHRQVFKEFKGIKSSTARIRGVTWLHKMEHYQNSGAALLSLAQRAGARRVLMLGYDAQRGPNGEVHHHGDHPKPLGNAGSMPKWPGLFRKAAHDLRQKMEIVNCSRATALNCFDRGDLDEELNADR